METSKLLIGLTVLTQSEKLVWNYDDQFNPQGEFANFSQYKVMIDAVLAQIVIYDHYDNVRYNVKVIEFSSVYRTYLSLKDAILVQINARNDKYKDFCDFITREIG